MAKRHAIIRKLDAVEALGSVTAICTDKTGTLTTNQMTVQKIFLGKGVVDVSGAGLLPEGRFEMDGRLIEVRDNRDLFTFLRISTLCNDSLLKSVRNGGEERWEILGDPTEGALVVASAKAGLERERLSEDYPRIDEIPFDSKKKYMATFHRSPAGKIEVYLKGAPEVVLDMCSGILQDGRPQSLKPRQKEDLLDVSARMARKALRVFAMAYKEIDQTG